MKQNFENLKNEILRRAKKANACTVQYKRVYTADTLQELMQVVKDNFYWSCRNKVIDVELIDKYKDEFNAFDIWANVDVSTGYLLASDNATVTAYGNATVRAYGNATVYAYDNATVYASGNATVHAYDNATVYANGNSKMYAYDNATVYAYTNATVHAYTNATVYANDNAYVTSFYTIKCKLSGNAIYRIRESNTIQYANNDIAFVKQ